MPQDDISAIIARNKAAARALEERYLFDGERSAKNYALNKMCMSLTSANIRAAFAADEAGYCASCGMDDATTALVRARDWIGMIRSGSNIYYVFKLASIEHVSMQHVGAQQNAMTLEEFRARPNSHREADHPPGLPDTKGQPRG